MRPNQFQPGNQVVYTPPGSNHRDIEYGVVTSTNTRWVFVRYTGDSTSKATHPDNLQIISPQYLLDAVDSQLITAQPLVWRRFPD